MTIHGGGANGRKTRGAWRTPLPRGLGAVNPAPDSAVDAHAARWAATRVTCSCCQWRGPSSMLKEFACPECGSDEITEARV